MLSSPEGRNARRPQYKGSRGGGGGAEPCTQGQDSGTGGGARVLSLCSGASTAPRGLGVQSDTPPFSFSPLSPSEMTALGTAGAARVLVALSGCGSCGHPLLGSERHLELRSQLQHIKEHPADEQLPGTQAPQSARLPGFRLGSQQVPRQTPGEKGLADRECCNPGPIWGRGRRTGCVRVVQGAFGNCLWNSERQVFAEVG